MTTDRAARSDCQAADHPQCLSPQQLRERTVDGRGLADIRLLQVEDGPGRGQRLLAIRNAIGIGIEIALDRGFDISSATWRGINIGWNSANGLPWPPHPIDAEEGIGFYRNLDGFLVTCGLDHIGGPSRTPADHYIHKHRREVFHPLHGRISSQRAALSGYGISWSEAEPTIWAEGLVRQSAVFGENLVLRRRVELAVFGHEIRVLDRIENCGFRPTPHAILYHVNFGYPLLDRHIEISGDICAKAAAAFNGEDKSPCADFVDYYQPTEISPGQTTSVELLNRNLAGGTVVRLMFKQAELPSFGIWRAYQSGVYALALEPAHPGLSAGADRSILNPGDLATYEVRILLASAGGVWCAPKALSLAVVELSGG